MIVEKCLQGSEEWHLLRLGVASASNFHRIVTPTGAVSRQATDYMYRLLGEWLAGDTLDGEDYQTPAMARGYMLQPHALGFYQMAREVDVEEVGFVFRDDGRLVGCSPDGLVDGGGVEIKCPLSAAHMKFLADGQLPDRYKPQVYGSMMVCGTEWWDFCSYHPQLPSRVERIHRDEKYISKLENALDSFSETMVKARDMLRAQGYEPVEVVRDKETA